MDISGIASVATAASQSQTANEVQIAVLKRAMEIGKQVAMQLVQAATLPAPGNPPHLGNQVDTFG